MSAGSWILGLLQSVVTDALFKRPINVTLQRKPDGTFDLKTQITPSGASPTTHVYYGNAGYPQQPGFPGYPGVAQPQQFIAPAQAPAAAPPPVSADSPDTAPPVRSLHIPEDFQA
jgi:hypothetical protein